MKVVRFTRDPLPPVAPRPSAPVALQVSQELLEATQAELREQSSGIRESLVVWAGRTRGPSSATITHLVVPACRASGLGLNVPIDERIKVVDLLRVEKLLAFADLHTHPATAFLSELDRARPFGVRDGFYAIVVPYFATRQATDGWAMYETRANVWKEVEPSDRLDQ